MDLNRGTTSHQATRIAEELWLRAPLKSETEPGDGSDALTCDFFILFAFILVRCTFAERVKESHRVRVLA
jgi:hypothetical protein